MDLPGRLYFAGHSRQWGGAVAHYDHHAPGRTAARAYLVTVGQLVDIVAQETYRAPGDDEPLERTLAGPLPGGAHELGPGRYETLRDVGRRDGRPMLTLTPRHGIDAVPHAAPTAAYLAVIAAGLRESRGWSPVQIGAYLAARRV